MTSRVKLSLLLSHICYSRYITLPQRLGCLSLVSGCGGPSTPGFLHSALMYYHGILAVGLLGGKVMLVDLNMDEAAESCETSPGGLMYLNPSSREVARLRRKTLAEGNHMVIELNIGGGSGSDKFAWHGVTFNAETVQVRI